MQPVNIVNQWFLFDHSILRYWRLWLLICWSPMICAQADTPVRSRAVDVVLLTDGMRLFGVAESSDPKVECCFVVRGDWLRAEHPEVVKRLEEIHSDEHADNGSEASVSLLRKRVKTLTELDERPVEHIGFLREQIRRIEKQTESLPPFYMLQLSDSQVRRRHHQTLKRRQLSVLGILNNVAGMETMNATELATHLQKIPPTQLRKELPTAQANSLSTSQRVLIQSERLFGKVARFVSVGDQYFANDGNVENVCEIAMQMLSDQLSRQLQNLLGSAPDNGSDTGHSFPPGARLPAAVADRVRKQEADIVEISSAVLQPRVGATVRIDVYRRDADAAWTLRVIGTGRAEMAEVTADRVRQAAEDPRVQQIAGLGQQLGVNRELTQAVSMGAAVEIALDRAQEDVQRQLTTIDANTAMPLRYRLISAAESVPE